MRTRQKQRIIIGTLCAVIVGLAVGYAVLSQQLNINGTSGITSNFNILFTNIEEGTMNGATTVNKQITDSTTATFTIDLKSPGSNGEYLITVENRGNIDAYVESINGIEEANSIEPTDIKFSIEGIKVNDKLLARESKVFKVKVNWDSSSTSIPDTNKDLTLSINFAQDTGSNPSGGDTITTVVDNLLDSSTDGTYNYMDGTYLKGSQDSNYVWFDGFLWRIMGKNADGSIRLITDESVTGIPLGASGTAFDYDNSYASDWLNNYFYPKLEDNDLIVKQTWCSEPAEDNTSARTNCTNNLSTTSSKVGMISLDEWNLSGGTNGYLENREWISTLTPDSNESLWGRASLDYVDGMAAGGAPEDQLKIYYEFNGSIYQIVNSLPLRPIINISSSVKFIIGVGTKGNPYQIIENNNIYETLKDNSHVGEYVTYAGRNYRVLEKSDQGVKLVLDGLYDHNNDGIIDDSDSFEYDENWNEICTVCSKINEETFINWITNNNETEKNKLVFTTWYEGAYWEGENYNDHLKNTENSYTGYVGLQKVGNLFTTDCFLQKMQQDGTEILGYLTYYLNTRINRSMIWYGNWNYGLTSDYEIIPAQIRPVIMIGPDVQILSGNGTFNSPYTI